MTDTQSFLLKLIRIAIDAEKNFDVPDSVDWRAVMDLSYDQSVNNIASDGLMKLYDAYAGKPLPPALAVLETPEMEDVKYNWYGQAMAAEAEYLGQNEVIAELARFYAEHGLDMMILKGYGLSLNYPIPSHRPVGDLDIYLSYKAGEEKDIPAWKYGDEAVAAELGVKVDDSSEHHTVFTYKKLSVENHYDFINTKIRRSSRYLDKILKELACDKTTVIKLGEQDVILPSANLNALFLLRHNAGHFAAEGISVRHLLDWALFVKNNSEKIDWRYLKETTQKYNMDKFLACLNCFCIEYFGLNPVLFPYTECAPKLKYRVFSEILRGPDFVPDASAVMKTKRWFKHLWKYRICYSDNMLSSLFYAILVNINKNK